MSYSSPGPLLAVRAAMLMLIALVIGLVAGGLSFLACRDVAMAVPAGGGGNGSAEQDPLTQ